MNNLAENCELVDKPRSMTKLDAAYHQLEGAIVSLFLGNWAASITLAAAAEGILPPKTGVDDLFQTAKKYGPAMYQKTETEIGDLLNEKKHWLKHHQTSRPDYKSSQDICQVDAVVMVVRALTRLNAHEMPIGANEILSERILEFQKWFKQNFPDWLSSSGSKAEKKL